MLNFSARLLPFASGRGHRPFCSGVFAHLQFLDREVHDVFKGSFHATDAGAVQGRTRSGLALPTLA